MIKTYTVAYGPNFWECCIGIDFDILDKKNIEYMVEFWQGWEDRLETHNGDYINTFLQQLGREIYILMTNGCKNERAVIEEFKSREGWSTMDNGYGIEILEVDDLSFQHYEFEVTEDPQ